MRNWQDQFENDIWYVENVSFLLDVKMFFALVKMVFSFGKRGNQAQGKGITYFIGYNENGQAMSLINYRDLAAAVLRRSHRDAGNAEIFYKNLRLDPAGRRVYVAQEAGETLEPELTQKEFELLHVLLINKGIVLTRQKLLNLVWGDDYFGEERIVDTHIKNLRKKLGTNYISTIRGVGYRIDKEAKSKSDD